MGKKMSMEQGRAFEKVVKQAIDAFVAVRDGGDTSVLQAADDQIQAYKREYNSKLTLKFGDTILGV